MKATIKSIPVTKVTEGMQVLSGGHVYKVAHIGNMDNSINNNVVTISDADGEKSEDAINNLKTIVVEYDDWENAGIGSVSGFKKQLPLKQSDWQQAIDDGLVDSGKEVEIEIQTVNADKDSAFVGKIRTIQVAQLIPQQKRLYSETEVRKTVFEFCEWTWTNMGEKTGLLYPPALSDRWKAWKDFKTKQP
jgi:hypothetical protein